MQGKTGLILQQKGKADDERRYELKAGRELHVVQKKQNKKKKFGISILALHDQGKRVYQYKKRWLILGMGTVAVMLISPELGKHVPFIPVPYMLYILSGLFFAAILFFMLLVHTFRCRYVFSSIYTNLPLVEFWINKPSRKEYQDFIAALESSIKQHKEFMKIAYDKQLAGELRTLRRVTEAGMLSESVYLAAKAKLLLMSDMRYRPSTDKQ